MKHILLTALALFGILSVTMAQEAPAPQNDKPRPDREEMRRKMQERMEKRLTEAAEKIRTRYDKDDDGKLDDTELAEMKKEFELAREVFPLAQSYVIIGKLDKDNDLILSKEELADAPKVLRENRAQGMRGGQGMGNRPQRPRRGENGEGPGEKRPPRRNGNNENRPEPPPQDND